MDKMLFSGFRFLHHNPGSGYDSVVGDGDAFVCGNTLPLGQYPEPTRLRKFNFLLVDLFTLFKGITFSAIHYIYPENTAFFSPLILKMLGKKIIYTIHLEEDYWFSSNTTIIGKLKRRGLAKSDIIISLSKVQTLEIMKRFPDKKVVHIPHGLDMNAPVPSDSTFSSRINNENRNIVIIGTNYRDFDSLEEIIRTTDGRHVIFDMIGANKEIYDRLSVFGNVIFHNRLNQEDYENKLSSSFLLLLPLTFATANNALLEAHKLYLPTACSMIPGVMDYVTDDTILFKNPCDFWSEFDKLARLIPSEYKALCVRTHEAAKERFAWSRVRGEIRRLVDGGIHNFLPERER